MKPWIDKHKPKELKEIPHKDEVLLLKNYINKKHPILLHGPTGTGKTTLAYLLAKELNLEILELNASDTRNKEQINNIMGQSSQQASLFNKGKLILIDEIDSLTRNDRGCISALTKIIKQTKHPIITTAIDSYEKKLKPIKKICKEVELPAIEYQKLSKILKQILEKENISYNETTLNSLARKANGDIRAAINDLQTYSILNKELNIENITDRDQKESIINALKLILKTTDANTSLKSLDNTDIFLDEIILWLEENIPKEYIHPNELEKAFEALAKADLFRSRIKKWQHWRFLVYQKQFMTAGVSLAKKEKYQGFTNYKRNSRILKIWINNMKSTNKKTIAEKLAKQTHTSKRNILKNFSIYKKFITKKEIINELNLSDNEILFLTK